MAAALELTAPNGTKYSQAGQLKSDGRRKVGDAESVEIDEGPNGESESWWEERERYWIVSIDESFESRTRSSSIGQ